MNGSQELLTAIQNDLHITILILSAPQPPRAPGSLFSVSGAGGRNIRLPRCAFCPARPILTSDCLTRLKTSALA